MENTSSRWEPDEEFREVPLQSLLQKLSVQARTTATNVGDGVSIGGHNSEDEVGVLTAVTVEYFQVPYFEIGDLLVDTRFHINELRTKLGQKTRSYTCLLLRKADPDLDAKQYYELKREDEEYCTEKETEHLLEVLLRPDIMNKRVV